MTTRDTFICRIRLHLVLTKYLVLVFLSDPTSTPNKPCHDKIALMPTTKEEICLGICGVSSAHFFCLSCLDGIDTEVPVCTIP